MGMRRAEIEKIGNIGKGREDIELIRRGGM